MEVDHAWHEVLTEAIRVHTRALCGAPWTQTHPCFAPLLQRLMECIRHHALDAAELTRRLRQPPLPRDDDVVRDLVLTATLAAGDERALALFLAEYGSLLKAIWRKSQSMFRVRDEEGYRDLIPDLLGLARRPSPLASYQGKSSLRSFLGVTFARLVINEWRREPRAQALPAAEPAAPPDLALVDGECYELVRTEIRQFCFSLAAEDQVCLRLFFQEFQQRQSQHGINKSIAALMGRAEGTVSRRRERIETALRAHFGSQGKTELHDCLRRLLAAPGAGMIDAFIESLTPGLEGA